MIKSKYRPVNRKGSTFSKVTGTTFKREILMNIKWILTRGYREYTTNNAQWRGIRYL